MTTAKVIAKNSIFLFLGDAIGYVLQLILVVYLARYLGDANFGKYCFVTAFSMLFLILSDIGLSVLMIREIARDTTKAGKYLVNISIIKLILSSFTIILVVTAVNFMPYPPDTIWAICIVAVTTFFTSFTSSFRSIFRAFERMEYELISKIAERIFIFISVLPVLYLGYGLIEVVLAMLISQVFIFIFTLILLIKKLTRPTLLFDLSLCKSLIKEGFPFALASVFSVIYFQTDTVMLSMMKGDAVVGWYNAAYRLVMALPFISTAFVGALYPMLSKYSTSSRDKLIIVYEKSFKFLLMLSIPIGIGTSLLADKIIIFLYGQDFVNSILALQILVWVASVLMIYSIVGYVLASINRQPVDTRTTCISALLNVGLNLLLIPAYSYAGAAITSVLSLVFLLTLEFIYLQRNGYKIHASKLVLKPLFAGIFMGLIIYSLKAISINFIIIICIAISIYATSLYILKAFDKDEIEMMRDMFKHVVSVRSWGRIGGNQDGK